LVDNLDAFWYIPKSGVAVGSSNQIRCYAKSLRRFGRSLVVWNTTRKLYNLLLGKFLFKSGVVSSDNKLETRQVYIW
jgi:hypothetical protein